MQQWAEQEFFSGSIILKMDKCPLKEINILDALQLAEIRNHYVATSVQNDGRMTIHEMATEEGISYGLCLALSTTDLGNDTSQLRSFHDY
jgi:hypothetical protein